MQGLEIEPWKIQSHDWQLDNLEKSFLAGVRLESLRKFDGGSKVAETGRCSEEKSIKPKKETFTETKKWKPGQFLSIKTPLKNQMKVAANNFDSQKVVGSNPGACKGFFC